MSKLWKKRSWGLKLNLEDLEGREVPAGNITAVVSGGILQIRSDNDFHAFSIHGTGDRSVALRPSVGTTINGSSQAVQFFGGITQGFDIQTGNGADSIIVSGVHGRNYLSIVTGGGDDVVHIVGGTNSPHSTWVRSGDGNDLIIVNNSRFREHFQIEAGEGNDTVNLGLNNSFGDNTRVNGNGGTNSLGNTGNQYRGGVVFANFGSQQNAILPVASDDTVSVASKSTQKISVLDNDVAIQGSFTLSSVKITSQPTSGTATVNADGSISYTNTSGTADSFRYTVANSSGGTSNEATVRVTVTSTTDPDTAAPVPTLATTAGSATNAATIPVTLKFNESVTGVETGDFTLTNATISGLSGSGDSYTFTLTPTAEGAFSVQFKADSAVDAANNKNSASNLLSVTSDKTAPTVTANALTTNDTTPTITGTVNDSTATVTVTVNGTSKTATINGSNWSATFDGSVLAAGTYTITAKATDPAGNSNTATQTDGLIIDTTAPTVNITSTLTSPTTTTPIPVTITFSEDVTDFTAADLTITNGTAGTLTTVNAKQYTISITPTQDGAVGVSLAAAKAKDVAGNDNTASNNFSITFDAGAPAVTITSTAGTSTKTSPIPFTATFSRNVTGFDQTDLQITNGTIASFTATDAKTYNFTITPNGQGAVTVNIPAAAAKDSNNNNSTAGGPFTRTFDTLAPGGTIATVVTNDNTPTITGTITEDGGSVTVFANGKTAVATVTGKTWTATFTDTFLDGVYNVTYSVTDAAGNSQALLNNAGLTVDTVRSTVQILSPLTSPTNAATIPIEIGFAEVVVGFDQSKVSVTNGTISNFQDIGDSQSYTFDITPTGDGPVTVNIAANAVNDPAGNGNEAGTFTITSDRLAPTATISTTKSSPTNGTNAPFTVTFSENVTDFVQSDIQITGGTISGFSAVSEKVYNFTVTPTADGQVTVSVPAGVAKDGGGTVNTAATDVSLVFDRTAPTASVTTTASNPTSTSPIPFTVTFNEDVTGFAAGDLTVTNGTVSNFQTVSPSKYTFDVTPTNAGAVSVSAEAGVANDTAGNGNAIVSPLSVTFNNSPDTVITTSASNPTNLAAIPFTVTFSQDVTGFEQSEVSLLNGTIDSFTKQNAKVYTFNVLPTNDGTVRVGVAADVAQNGVNAGNNAAVSVEVVSDRTVPTAMVSTTSANPTGAATIPFTVTFSEAVTGFAEGDVTLVNATISGFTPDANGKVYTFSLTPLADGAVGASVAAAVAKDLAGNDNTAGAEVTVVSDRSGPTTVISTTATNPTNSATLPFTVTFSEAVTGFEQSDIVLVNASISNFQADANDKVYTFDLTPLADGEVGAKVAAGVAKDSLNNDNIAATSVTVVSDRTAPTVVVSTTSGNPNNSATLPFTVTFSEAVTGFEMGDVTLVNATISNFQADANGKVYTFDLSPIADGAVGASVAAAAAKDAANNDSAAGAEVTVVSDRTVPTVMISTTATDPTNAATLPFTVTFSEVMTGFVEGDIELVNATISGFTADPDGKTFTFSLSPVADGDVGAKVAAAVAKDAAGNDNSAATSVTVVSDRTAPGVTVSTMASSPTNAATVSYTVTFTEVVTDFVVGDLTLVNGNASNFMADPDGKTFTFDITPVVDGDVTVSVAAAVAKDAAGNDNTAGAGVTVVSDKTAPTVTITTSAMSPTSAGSIPVTVTFSEAVSGFVEADLGLSNGTSTNFTANPDGKTFTFDLSPVADGNVSVSIVGMVAEDLAGNANTAATDLVFVFDRTNPTVAFDANPVNAITGTASGTGTTVATLQISISDGTNFWDGTAFASATEVFFDVTTANDFAAWSFTFAAGTYTVHAVVTDDVGLITNLTQSVTVMP